MKRIFITNEQCNHLKSSVIKLMEANKSVLKEESRKEKKIIERYIREYSIHHLSKYMDVPCKDLPQFLKRQLLNGHNEDEGLFGQISRAPQGCNKFIDFLRINLLQQVGIHGNVGPLQYIEGICRIMLKELGYYSWGERMRGGDIMRFLRMIKFIYFKPEIFLKGAQLNINLNDMTYEEFMGTFTPYFKEYELYIKNEIDKEKNTAQLAGYKVIEIKDKCKGTLTEPLPEYAQFLRSLHKYTDWCICGDQGTFEYAQYVSSGSKFYICLKDGFENIPREQGEECPLDEYGLSMIAVLVAQDGLPDNITTRWNHDFDGENNPRLWEANQLYKITGIDYFSTFKPRSEEELKQMGLGGATTAEDYRDYYDEEELYEGAEPESDTYKIGFEAGGFEPFGHVNENYENELTAWHGTDADFDKFSTDFIGKGEGSQVYGWGIYVSGNKKTGEMYAKNVSASKTPTLQWDKLNTDESFLYGSPWLYYWKFFGKLSKEHPDVHLWPKDKIINVFETEIYNKINEVEQKYKDKARFCEAYRNEARSLIDYVKNVGLTFGIKILFLMHNEFLFKMVDKMLYEVEIPDDDGYNYIEWIGENKAINEIIYKTGLELSGDEFGFKEAYKEKFPPYSYGNCSHGEIYENVCKILDAIKNHKEERSDKLLSLALNKKGFIGIKVPVAYRNMKQKMSKADFSLGFNYVIFDENDVKIKNKEKTAALYESNEKGSFDYRKEVKSLAKFMRDEGLNVYPYPKIFLNWEEQDGLFIKTGYYNPTEKKIVAFCKDRHPKDVMRTIAHEFIHHYQNLEGKNLDFSTTNVKDNEELEKIEGEAYLKGNIYFRKWTEYTNSSKDELLNENIVYETTDPESIDLSSFKIKKELNPKFWKNDKLDSRIRLKLLDIADDFLDFLDVNWVKPKDVLMTGSLANFNWDTKYSDIDLHILMDFSEVDKRTDFVESYFKSKKELWNSEHEDLTIYGFSVELYVQDINAKAVSTGVYSLDQNKWLEEPEQKSMDNIKLDKKSIRKSVAKYIDEIEDLEKSYREGEKNEYTARTTNEKSKKIFDAIKKERTSGLDTSKKELSNGNIVFKALRRLGYIEKITNLETETYNKMNSIS